MRLLIAASLFALAAVQPGAAADLSAYKRPLTVPFEGVTAYSPQLATLGKMLFFDPRLSGNKNMTCASCHNPSFGFETPVTTPIGAANTALARQAPTVLNCLGLALLLGWPRAEPGGASGRSDYGCRRNERQARHRRDRNAGHT